jgi:hypothetical protein
MKSIGAAERGKHVQRYDNRLVMIGLSLVPGLVRPVPAVATA